MAQAAVPGSLIIAGVGEPQMAVFASFARNVTVAGIPANMSGFERLAARGWTRVYLYDSWVSLQDPAFFARCQCYPPYYQALVLNRSLTAPLWVGPEGYALVLAQT
jgi:hypothetical protein